MAVVESSLFFAADVHWRPAEGEPDPTGAFGRFLAELAARARGGVPVRLVLAGDLFDFWFERGGSPFPCFAPHLAALADTVRAGVVIEVLYGNRDFTYRTVLQERCGVQVPGERAELDLEGGGRALVLHGDQLCTRDWRYQLYRRLIRSRLARWLLSLLPMAAMRRVIARMRQASRAEVRRKKPAAMGIVDEAVAVEHRRGGFARVICGHVHESGRRRVAGAPEGSELVVLGPWESGGGSYAAVTGGEIVLCPYS